MFVTNVLPSVLHLTHLGLLDIKTSAVHYDRSRGGEVLCSAGISVGDETSLGGIFYSLPRPGGGKYKG